jgi:plastocyanin
MLGRRLLVLMAVLLGLTALAAALAPRPTVVPERGSVTPSPTATPSPPAEGAAGSHVVTRTVDADMGAKPARVRARAGDTIRLSVRGDVLDAVELKGLDEIEPVEPGSPARFEFRAEAPGEHPIVLLEADRRVGLLAIRPAAGG